MPKFNIIAGINGTGKSSIRGVLCEYVNLGTVVDPDLIARENNVDIVGAGKIAVQLIDECIDCGVTFTQETTLSGSRIVKEMQKAKKNGFEISMYYIGLESVGESLSRIANRAQKGGHNIPEERVIRRYEKRIFNFMKCVPYCDEIVFYDNQNGFIKVAVYNKVDGFRYWNGHRPNWIKPLEASLSVLRNKEEL